MSGRTHRVPLALGLVVLVTVAGCAAAPRHTVATTASPRAAACPAGAHRPGWDGSRRVAGAALVPGAPVVVTVCRYADGGGHALKGRRTLRGAGLADVRDRLNGQRAVTGTYSCPMDTGAAHLLLFGYPGGATLTVRVNDSGCRFAGNGRRTVWAPPGLANRLNG